MKKLDRSLYVVQGHYDEQSQSCLICLQPIVFPVQCQKCLSIYCAQCANRWKRNHNRCPKKCSNNKWTFKQKKSLNILLRCPYDNQNCKHMSAEQFQTHLKICQKAPQEIKNMKTLDELRKQNLCNYGHKLCYIGYENRHMVFHDCAVCQTREVCRSFCKICRENSQAYIYCCTCRKPPVKKSRCAQEHQFQVRKSNLHGCICDICLMKVIQTPNRQYCYYEPKCDFVLCVSCHKKLPEQEQPSAIRSLEHRIQNIELPE